MEFKLSKKTTDKNSITIIDAENTLQQLTFLSKEEKAYATKKIQQEQYTITFNQLSGFAFIYYINPKKTSWQTTEAIRKAGAEFHAALSQNKISEITIYNNSKNEDAAFNLAQGMALSSYQFLKYRKDRTKKESSLKTISFEKSAITTKKLDQLQIITEAVFHARNLVNEPLNYLSAEQLAKEITTLGKASGFKTTTLNKAQITKEKMGGILAVNRGSIHPPTFTVMEYKPSKPLNKAPLVLVGKGIVYDTGGLSLKPTAASMDRMKSDMSGAALVTASMYALSKMKLPLHVIALVPATDNRPGENAYVPGDIITMYSGTTVEVLNTDAEGRLVLADALHWAKRYKPELVMDFATLTGAASVAVGDVGIVCMGNADEALKNKFKESGFNQYERLVEYPLWEEYGDLIKSEFADLKNIGGPTGGAITAGKFLEHFTDYPWMHFDIAGVSFSMSKKSYIPAGGTGYGIRMLLDFLINYGKN